MGKRWSVEGHYPFHIEIGDYYSIDNTFNPDTVTACTYRSGVLWTMSEELAKLVII